MAYHPSPQCVSLSLFSLSFYSFVFVRMLHSGPCAADPVVRIPSCVVLWYGLAVVLSGGATAVVVALSELDPCESFLW